MSFLKASYIALKAVEMNWFPFTYILDNLITNSIHAWLTKDYRSSGMFIEFFHFFRIWIKRLNTNQTSFHTDTHIFLICLVTYIFFVLIE